MGCWVCARFVGGLLKSVWWLWWSCCGGCGVVEGEKEDIETKKKRGRVGCGLERERERERERGHGFGGLKREKIINK